ncbi:PfkB family carbohydrate kinase [Streptosporangium saharense]|uniref:PfkB family carbohydrate kinase n=1 Tax=Streptosporangium saharense TaxID=1706840 RepID=UPI0036A1359D
MLNLGSEPLQPAIEHAAATAEVIAVQTGLPEQHTGQADATVDALFNRLHPTAAVVTLGRHGAVARTGTGRHYTPAGHGLVIHTHGAGAAFSAGFAAAYLVGHELPTCLHLACTTGTAHCAAAHPRAFQGART